jgi:hypothetical protein
MRQIQKDSSTIHLDFSLLVRDNVHLNTSETFTQVISLGKTQTPEVTSADLTRSLAMRNQEAAESPDARYELMRIGIST